MSWSEPTPDVLGEDWVARTLLLPADDAGIPIATLVHRLPRHRRAVLYVHGFVDYFFQTHHADTWDKAGYDFYALDLRDYGRSLRAGRTPNWITDLGTYAEEIDAALDLIRADHDLVLLEGHSTGGLITALYAADHPVDGLVLNSPWLDLAKPPVTKAVATLGSRVLAKAAPQTVMANLGQDYGRSLHVNDGGEWDYDLRWKPHEGFPARAAWLNAVRRGHARLNRGLDIDAPILLATSAAGGDPDHPSPAELAGTDVVLSPPQMWAHAHHLGVEVATVKIPGGRHDLTLSERPARERFAAELTAWLRRRFPGATGRPS